MKPLIPVTLVLLCTLAGRAGAQVQATADVKATVEQDLNLASSGETNFGRIGNFAHTETIDPKAPTADQTTAQFTATSSGNNMVIYTCPIEVRLTGPGAASMTFTTNLSTNSSDVQSGSFEQTCSNPFGYSSSTHYFWLGGSLKVLSSQEPGSYNGLFTLTATYQ